MEFDFNEEKNVLLFERRGITFYQIIEGIAANGVLLDIQHPNKGKFPNQRMFVVEYNNYTYCVPYVKNNNIYFLKTIFPNRKFLYLIKKEEN